MKTIDLTRRQFIKATGALIVSFNLFPSSDLFAQLPAAEGDIDPTHLTRGWPSGQDGNVTVYTSKVELGTGTITALAQIVAEELDVPFNKIKMDRATPRRPSIRRQLSGSRTIERAGPQIRQAAAAARKELLRLGAAKLGAPAEKLTVVNGMVSVAGSRRSGFPTAN